MVADLCFCGRSIDRFRQFVRFFQAFRKLNSADSAVFLITCPAASCYVSADNALNREHLKFSAHHAVAVKLRLAEELRHFIYICCDHVVRQDILRHLEPEFGHLCENCSFLCDRIFQNHIKAADPVGSYKDQAVAVVVDLAYFTFFDWLHFTYLVYS